MLVRNDGRVIQPARRWDGVALALLVIAAPLLLFPGGWRTLALLLLPLVWLVNRIVTGHFIRRTPLDVAVLLLLVMVLVSLYATYDMANSLPKIAGVLLGTGMLYGMAGFASTPRRLGLVVLGLLVAMAAFVTLVLVGTAWGAKVPALKQIGMMFPALIRNLPGAAEGFHPNEVGGALTWIVFLPVAVAIGLWSRQRLARSVIVGLLLVVLSAAMVLTLVLTQSRSAWLGLVAGGAIFLCAVGRWGRIVLVVTLLVAVGVIVSAGPETIVQKLVETPELETGTLFTPNVEGRMEIWSRAIYGIQDFAFTGMGMNNFRRVVHLLYPLFLIGPDADIGHAHNEFLQAGLDLGLPGLMAFLAIEGLGMLLAYQAFRSGGSAWERWTAAGILAGFVAHGVYGLTDAVALGAKPGLWFWVLLGLTVGLYHHSQTRPQL